MQRVTFHIDGELREWLDKRAKREQRSLANLIRYLLTAAMEAELEQAKP